ncbi:IucA/IucC family protein [Burkholderia sp. Ax-1724]|uniref:IucA/IucC family protein n=1 Tax=Burkholderia sp. Ax-1724 TaxID=2608336 RepID=UPI0014236D85|nr:IucA/IucC family protein [Burkholderia sp. Ax-1724]NIF54331.1 IucA/IucC family siderophore biosynthesis protein [Burkholderia sp. Ax-1724]
MLFSSPRSVSLTRNAALQVSHASHATHRVDEPHSAESVLSALDRRLLEQYFNTYCRETGQFDPRVSPDADRELADDVCAVVQSWRDAGLDVATIAFPGDGSRLYVALDYFSLIGFHRVGRYAIVELPDGSGHVQFDGIEALIVRIAQSLARGLAISPDWIARFTTLMQNSVDRVRYYHTQTPDLGLSAFVRAEQSLRFGHVFHVTSKASDGFAERDMQAFAPELGASFRLHYFAVATNCLDTRSIDGTRPPIDPEAMHAAAALLGDSEYRLLPCHPWQAEYLLQQETIQKLLARRDLISLGPLGEVVWPTSSVRTVWLPVQRRFLKLPLNVRITNFIRNNPPVQVVRALDASLYIASLPSSDRASDAFEVLLDGASASLETTDDALKASSAVLYRDGMSDEVGDYAQVLATVMEEPAEGESSLAMLLEEALGTAPGDQPLVAWWARYLNVTLMPLLRLFARYGVSLEAHLQNTMVAFQDGWPVRGYVRDMEGASISRARCLRPLNLPDDSPALYRDEDAWHRFLYYVLVNHIGHVIAGVARAGYGDEAMLWSLTADIWSRDPEPAVTALLRDVRGRTSLPAKANMMSCFGRHGELPAWVEIPNPLATVEVSV